MSLPQFLFRLLRLAAFATGGHELCERQPADDGVRPVPAGRGGSGGGVPVVLVHGPATGGHDALGCRAHRGGW